MFGKECDWCGETKVERWEHSKNHHWSPALEAAVAYYHPRLHEYQRLESVLSQVAGVLTRGGAPLASNAIDRRCFCVLWQAVSPEENVQSLICFLLRARIHV